MKFIIILFHLWFIIWYESCNASPDVIHKTSVGLTFVRHARNLFPVSGHAKVAFAIQLPPSITEIKPVRKPYGVTCSAMREASLNELCRNLVHSLGVTFNISQKFLDEIRQTTIDIYDVVDTFRIRSTRKRSWIPISHALTTIFGVASEDTVRTISQNVENLYRQQIRTREDNLSLHRAIAQFDNITSTRFDHVWHAINTSAEMIMTSIEHLSNVQHKVDLLYQNYYKIFNFHLLHSHFHILANKLQLQRQVLSNLRLFEQGLNKLLHGKLPVEIVSLSHLRAAIRKISKREQNVNSIDMSNVNLAIYYQITGAQAMIIKNTLIITMNLPNLIQNSPFNLYKLVTNQVLNHGQEGFTKLTGISKFMAIAQDQSRYQLLTDDQAAECTKTYACPHLAVTMTTTVPTCELAVYMDWRKDITAHCNFKVFLGLSIFPQIIPLPRHSFLLINVASPIKLTCDTSTKYLNIGNYSKLDVPCNCDLVITSFNILTDKSDCDTGLISPEITYPVNLALALAFDFEKYMDPPITSFVSKSSPKLQIPDMTAYRKLIKTNLLEDARLGHDINHVAKIVSQYEPSDTGAYITPEFYDNFWNTTQIIITSCIFLWNLILSIIVIFMAYKMKLLPLMAVQQDPVNAFTIPISPTPEMTTHNNFSTVINLNQWVVTILMICATLFCLYHIINLIQFCKYKMSRCYRVLPWCCNPHSTNQKLSLYLRISTDKDVLVVFLQEIPYDQSLCRVTECPELTSITVFAPYCLPKAKLRFSGPLKVQFAGIMVPHRLNTIINISWNHLNQLTTILACANTTMKSVLLCRSQHTNLLHSVLSPHNCYHDTNRQGICTDNLMHAETSRTATNTNQTTPINDMTRLLTDN